MNSSLVQKWEKYLPFDINPLQLEDFFANRKIYPNTLPQTERGFWLFSLLLREKLEKILPSEEKIKRLILSSKVLSPFPTLPLFLLFLIDTLQPKSVLEVFLKEGKKRIGTVISLEDIDWKKEEIGRFDLLLKGKKQTVRLRAGEISLLKLKEGEELTLEFYLRGAKIEGKSKTKISVLGGKVGVVIDSRGRPIRFEDRERIKRWVEVFK